MTPEKQKKVLHAWPRVVQEYKTMRELQRRFFSSKDNRLLSQAKAAEKRLDDLINELDGLF